MLNVMERVGKNIEKSLLGTVDEQNKINHSAEFWRDYYLAGEAGTPAAKLAWLVEYRDPIIRKRVAENLHLPSYVQWLLVNDSSADVRLALTTNPSTIVEVAGQLANDQSELVRFSLARNTNMPVPTLIHLSRDNQPNIATRAQQTLEEIFCATRLSAA